MGVRGVSPGRPAHRDRKGSHPDYDRDPIAVICKGLSATVGPLVSSDPEHETGEPDDAARDDRPSGHEPSRGSRL